jgi:hypothetical protein
MPTRFETLFLVGTGIERNPWEPVCDAINHFRHTYTSESGSVRIEDSDRANFWLGLHVYRGRFLWCKDVEESPAKFDVPTFRAGFKNSDALLKESIAEKLVSATRPQTTRLTARCGQLLDECQAGAWGDTFAFLTTNWDLLLEQSGKVAKESVFHLHGSVDDRRTMYLPTEISPENYRDDEQRKAMAGSLATMWLAVRDAGQIVVYGLSLSPMDAELAHLLSLGLEEHPKPLPLTVINLAGDMDRVINRISMLCPAASEPTFKRVEVERE